MLDEEAWVVPWWNANIIDFYDETGLLGTLTGPAGWADAWGCAYSNEDNNKLYIGGRDGQIAYGNFLDYDTPISWTTLVPGAGTFVGMGYYAPQNRTAYGRYLFTLERISDPWTNTLYVWNVNDAGVPEVDTPAYIFDLNSFLDPEGAAGGIEWDGEHLWVLHQSEPDYVIEFDLELDDTNITPKSLGGIKANFR